MQADRLSDGIMIVKYKQSCLPGVAMSREKYKIILAMARYKTYHFEHIL